MLNYPAGHTDVDFCDFACTPTEFLDAHHVLCVIACASPGFGGELQVCGLERFGEHPDGISCDALYIAYPCSYSWLFIGTFVEFLSKKEIYMKKFLFVCGGTGGHIFPAVAIAESLKKMGVTQITFAGRKDSMEERLVAKNWPYEYISAVPLHRGPFLKNLALSERCLSLSLLQFFSRKGTILRNLR